MRIGKRVRGMGRRKGRRVGVRILAAVLAGGMAVSLAGCSKEELEAKLAGRGTTREVQSTGESGEEKSGEGNRVTVVCDESLMAWDSSQAAEEKMQKLSGLTVEVSRLSHEDFNAKVMEQMEGGEVPDVILLSPSQYEAYARAGILWNMSTILQRTVEEKPKAGENGEASQEEKEERERRNAVWRQAVTDQRMAVDGMLYGVESTLGTGCVTYVKRVWLNAVGMEEPKNWEEYLTMLKLFATKDPDGNGEDDTYGLSAPGLTEEEYPYTWFLPEFYQKAVPDFEQDVYGNWHDGFLSEEMKGALLRLQEVYREGYLDPLVAERSEEDVKELFCQDKTGVITYWAGEWEEELSAQWKKEREKRLKELARAQKEADAEQGSQAGDRGLAESNTGDTGQESVAENALNEETEGKLLDDYDYGLIKLAPIEELGSYSRVPVGIWAITTACKEPEQVFTKFMIPLLEQEQEILRWKNEKVEESYEGMTQEEMEEGKERRKEAEKESLTFLEEHSEASKLPASSKTLDSSRKNFAMLKREVICQVVTEGKDVSRALEEYERRTKETSEKILKELNHENE